MEAGTATIKVEADMATAEEALRRFKAEFLELEAIVDRLIEKLGRLHVDRPHLGAGSHLTHGVNT